MENIFEITIVIINFFYQIFRVTFHQIAQLYYASVVWGMSSFNLAINEEDLHQRSSSIIESFKRKLLYQIT